MKNILLISLIIILFSGCSTLQIDVDYDDKYMFDDETKHAIVHHTRER